MMTLYIKRTTFPVTTRSQFMINCLHFSWQFVSFTAVFCEILNELVIRIRMVIEHGPSMTVLSDYV